MNKETAFSVICIIFVVLLAAFYVNQYWEQMNKLKGGTSGNQSQNQSTVILTASEVAKHSTAGDCWMIVQNKVYAVTNYENMHPGGATNIIAYCGKDATQAFSSIKNGQGHSAAADMAHVAMLIGDLNSPITINITIPGNNITVQTNTSSGTSVSLTAQEVAKHSTAQDCWIIVQGKVYAVTNYENMHPGGAANIITYCGRDATSAFSSIKGGQGHSAAADMAHVAMLIGDLNSQVNVNLSTVGKNLTNVPRGGDDDEED